MILISYFYFYHEIVYKKFWRKGRETNLECQVNDIFCHDLIKEEKEMNPSWLAL